METNKKRAFTLIELVVVVIIIGILSSIAFPEFMRVKERAHDKRGMAILRVIDAAERDYKMDTGLYWPDNQTSPFFDLSIINSVLSLDIAGEDGWSYTIVSPTGHQTYQAILTRNSGGYGREWHINSTIRQTYCVPVSGFGCP
jgi:prepilin-type N-terminal cleavage/methylation domain-containing protein